MSRTIHGNLTGKAAHRTIDDVLDDAKTSTKPALCRCGNAIENPWYGDKLCYDCQREAQHSETFGMWEFPWQDDLKDQNETQEDARQIGLQ